MTEYIRFRRAVLVVVLLIVALMASALPSTPESAAQGPSDGTATLNMIQSTIVPPRDRIDLARRLLGVTDIPAPPTSATPHHVGDIVTFWVDNLDQDYEFQVDAELVYLNDYVYMYVETSAVPDIDLARIQRSADDFANVIRPRLHDVFGSEWSPGIDGDPHIVVLHAHDMGSWVAAYYGSSSQYPTEAVATSNEAEMFFVNLDAMEWAIGTDYYESVLAHEFQHMIHWAVDSNEDSWLNEGLSELAAMLAGYGASDFSNDYLAQPNIQLTTWPEGGGAGLNYGGAFMFTAYFYERYGEEGTMALVRDRENGMTSVETTLALIDARDPATGDPVTAEDLFADWLVTNLLMDASVGDGRYAYTDPAMVNLPPVQAGQRLPVDGKTYGFEVPQWGGSYYRVPGGDTAQRVRATFTGADTVRLVPTEAAHSGHFAWWSNRGDDSDMRLTRTFDLSNVSSATLNFWTWYYIENLWDYAYVMVSVDGGATWTPIATGRTTTDDPHSNAYGPGYTGQSNGWVEESIDLTPYVGGEVQVRFEYITDDAVNQPGMLIDDVSIPEIGYSDDFEAGFDAWNNEGWLLTDNVLPQEFTLQLVQPSNTEQPVTRWLGAGDAPNGSWDFMVGGEYGDAILVVSGLTPVTTEPAAFDLTLESVP